MVNENKMNKNNSKTFNFYMMERMSHNIAYDDDGEHGYTIYSRNLCVKINKAGKLLDKFHAPITAGGYGTSQGNWGVYRNVTFNYGKKLDRNLKVQVTELIDSVIREYGIDYDPTRDRISYEYNPLRETDSDGDWTQQHSVSSHSKVIENEMKRLIPEDSSKQNLEARMK